MQSHTLRWIALTSAFVLLLFHTRADDALLTDEALCSEWFGAAVHEHPLTLTTTNTAINEVTSEGKTVGWVFRTDQVPPVCKGKRGEIAVLVALGVDGRIKGLHVQSYKEDKKYFARLTSSFFQQFQNRRADGDTSGIDAVTRATYSSRAIIRDVMEGAKHIASLPEVAAKIKQNEDCSLTKTAAMFHN